MSQRIRLIATQEATGATAGAATCVRLCNTHSGDVVVAVSETVGAATSQFFTMTTDTVEYLEKSPTEVIWTDTSIKANKVGFSN